MRGLQTSAIPKQAKSNPPKHGLHAEAGGDAARAQQRRSAQRVGKRESHAKRHQPHKALHVLREVAEGALSRVLRGPRAIAFDIETDGCREKS